MLTEATTLLRELQSKINILSRDPLAGLSRIEKILQFIDQSLLALKGLIESGKFADLTEEVKFFKEVNPEFYALWIYYSSVYNIQSHAFPASSKQRIKYLGHELRKIDDFFFHHVDFYKYFRLGKSHRDLEFFTRNTGVCDVNVDLFAAVMDRRVCTLYSFTLATILANERLKCFINDTIESESKLTPMRADSHIKLLTMQWTAPKTGLVELIYACYAGKVFNNGDATIEAITRFCEEMLGVELSAQTVTFQEILRRKKGPATFIDWLKNEYLIYIDRIEEKARLRNLGR